MIELSVVVKKTFVFQLIIFISLIFMTFSCSSTPKNQTFLDFVQKLYQAEPLDINKLEEIFGPSVQCDEKSIKFNCRGGDFHVGEVTIGSIDFRSEPTLEKKSIIILDKLVGDCVSIEDIEKRFGISELKQGCTDMVECYYHTIKGRHARISASLVGNMFSHCASSIILDRYS